MRNIRNDDLKIELEPQNERNTKCHRQEAVTGRHEQFAAGYLTLDKADCGDYSSKERRGLSRDANYPRRY